jgi:hypothetical protein
VKNIKSKIKQSGLPKVSSWESAGATMLKNCVKADISLGSRK